MNIFLRHFIEMQHHLFSLDVSEIQIILDKVVEMRRHPAILNQIKKHLCQTLLRITILVPLILLILFYWH